MARGAMRASGVIDDIDDERGAFSGDDAAASARARRCVDVIERDMRAPMLPLLLLRHDDYAAPCYERDIAALLLAPCRYITPLLLLKDDYHYCWRFIAASDDAYDTPLFATMRYLYYLRCCQRYAATPASAKMAEYYY